MKTTRQATPEESAGIHKDMALRAKAGEEVRAALAKYCTPEKIAEVIASLPPDAQRRVARECLSEPPVRRTIKFTNRRKKP